MLMTSYVVVSDELSRMGSIQSDSSGFCEADLGSEVTGLEVTEVTEMLGPDVSKVNLSQNSYNNSSSALVACWCHGYQLLCDAHTVFQPHRGTTTLFLFYSLSSFSNFSFYVFVTLIVPITFLCYLFCLV